MKRKEVKNSEQCKKEDNSEECEARTKKKEAGKWRQSIASFSVSRLNATMSRNGLIVGPAERPTLSSFIWPAGVLKVDTVFVCTKSGYPGPIVLIARRVGHWPHTHLSFVLFSRLWLVFLFFYIWSENENGKQREKVNGLNRYQLIWAIFQSVGIFQLR